MSGYFQVYSADWQELTAFFAGNRPEALEDLEDLYFDELDSEMLEDDEEDELVAALRAVLAEGVPAAMVTEEEDEGGLRYQLFTHLVELEEGTGVDDEVVEEPVGCEIARALFTLVLSKVESPILREVHDAPEASVRFLNPAEAALLGEALKGADKAGALTEFLEDEVRREELFEPLVEAGDEGRGLILIIG